MFGVAFRPPGRHSTFRPGRLQPNESLDMEHGLIGQARTNKLQEGRTDSQRESHPAVLPDD